MPLAMVSAAGMVIIAAIASHLIMFIAFMELSLRESV
jgi:hypothetical protein